MVEYCFQEIERVLSEADKDISCINLKKNANDYSILFFKTLVLKFVDGKKKYLLIKKGYEEFIPGIYKYEEVKAVTGFVRVEYDLIIDFEKLTQLLKNLYEDSKPAQTFGCCHNFIKCSDALICVHPDPIIAVECMYKTNLEKGKVFYGKNRNVDYGRHAMFYDFIAIDFETANYNYNSACSIGIVAVKDKKIVVQLHFHIQPPSLKFNKKNIDIHGITPDLIEDAPKFDEIWDKIKHFFSDNGLSTPN